MSAPRRPLTDPKGAQRRQEIEPSKRRANHLKLLRSIATQKAFAGSWFLVLSKATPSSPAQPASRTDPPSPHDDAVRMMISMQLCGPRRGLAMYI
jgi:hypothetical protein